MSLKKISKDQPEKFEFNQQSLEAAKKILSNYPKGKEKSAVMALLYIAQNKTITGYLYQQSNILLSF